MPDWTSDGGRHGCIVGGYPRWVPASRQTLTLDQRRRAALWAADCTQGVLPLFEDDQPGDTRVRAAIAQARAFGQGDLAVAEAIARRGGEAGGAARAASSPQARAAAYAAEQAAAVAHMGAHALGAAGYVGKARLLAQGLGSTADADVEVVEQARRLVDLMGASVAADIAQLPPLGEDRSGPLATGRLSAGQVGAVIRAIQERLRHTRLGRIT